MMQTQWTLVDRYLTDLLVPSDPVLEAALAASVVGGLPAINVAPNEGKLLYLLARLMGARRILEIGTLAGYSTIWLARALPPGGQLVTLEANRTHAEIARGNLARAGLENVVDLRVGPAADTLPRLIAEAGAPYDLVFIDADKPSYPAYWGWSLQLTRVGGLIIADNVVRDGKVADASTPDENAQGVRKFLDLVAAETRVETTAVQTVGSKGWDGFALALVTAGA